MILLQEFSLYKKAQLLLKNCTRSIAPGSILGVIGKSGQGKSSLLRCMVGLDTDYTGTITLDGKNVTEIADTLERAQLITFVPQHPVLWPQLSAYENIVNPMLIKAPHKKEDIKLQAEELIKALSLENIRTKFPAQLSGGQKQRIALARALLLNSKYILLDEPSSTLDAHTSAQLGILLQERARAGTTIIITSHDLSFIKPIANSLLLLQNQTLTDVTSYGDLACLYDQ